MPTLGVRVGQLLDDDETERTVGIGISGGRFVGWAGNCRSEVIDVETVRFNTERSERQLKVGYFEGDFVPVLVDDIAVSGQTMRSVVDSLNVQPRTVALGMLFKSKTTKRRIAVDDMRVGFTYCRDGGGNPPINSYTTLVNTPKRLAELSAKYFRGVEDEFTQALPRFYNSYDLDLMGDME